MSLRNTEILSVGECMVELARTGDGHFEMAFGGDTFNTAVYLARLGGRVAYLTALGDDPYSRQIAVGAAREGIDTGNIVHVAGRMPGLYLIETDAGERTFWYWRETSPARSLFELPEANRVVAAMAKADWIYFSGITLSLYSARSLDTFANAIAAARSNGVRVAMDGNFRPSGWKADDERARSVYERFWAMCDLALPTFEDEAALWGDDSPSATIARLRQLGVPEICIKQGERGATTFSEGAIAHVACPISVVPVDTTAAGDSFNAAYLAARIEGQDVGSAAAAGHRLAAIVIAHRGAIAPAEAMRGYDLAD